jgi:hypothetical protein
VGADQLEAITIDVVEMELVFVAGCGDGEEAAVWGEFAEGDGGVEGELEGGLGEEGGGGGWGLRLDYAQGFLL